MAKDLQYIVMARMDESESEDTRHKAQVKNIAARFTLPQSAIDRAIQVHELSKTLKHIKHA